MFLERENNSGKFQINAINKIKQISLSHAIRKSITDEHTTSAITTPSTGLLKETGIWPTKERTEYLTLMLIHSTIDSNRERISQKIILEQRKKGMPNKLYERDK